MIKGRKKEERRKRASELFQKRKSSLNSKFNPQ
jgi:hypothetical protein